MHAHLGRITPASAQCKPVGHIWHAHWDECKPPTVFSPFPLPPSALLLPFSSGGDCLALLLRFASGLDPMAESSPATLFVLQLVFIAIMCISGVWYLGKASKRSAEGLQKKAVINRKIVDKRALVRFLEDAGCVSANTIASRTGFNESKRELVQFTDGSFFRWFGDYPLVTMEIDLEHDFVLSATLSWDYMGKRISRCDVYQLVCDMLVESGSISTDDPRNPKKPWEK